VSRGTTPGILGTAPSSLMLLQGTRVPGVSLQGPRGDPQGTRGGSRVKPKHPGPCQSMPQSNTCFAVIIPPAHCNICGVPCLIRHRDPHPRAEAPSPPTVGLHKWFLSSFVRCPPHRVRCRRGTLPSSLRGYPCHTARGSGADMVGLVALRPVSSCLHRLAACIQRVPCSAVLPHTKGIGAPCKCKFQ